MRIEELNWFDVEEYLKHEDRLILVLGACEQHGFLSLLTDVKIPVALADAASQKTGVFVAPPLNFGCSPYFLAYPGTFSLRTSTLLDVVEDLVRSAYRQGFRLKPTHANWLEAFPFTQVSDLPQEEKIPPRIPGLMNADQARQVYGDGSFGGPYLASETVMQDIFQAALEDVLQLLKFE